MKRGKQAVAVLVAVSCCQAAAVHAQDDFQAKTYKSTDGKVLNYRIHIPSKMDSGQKYPLVILFHGAGERGGDNNKQLTHGARAILDYSVKNNSPAIIVVPQCPGGMQWVNTPWNADSHTMTPEPAEPMRLSIELLQQLIKEQPVDTKRLYVTGLSMGGFAVWDIIQRKPDAFAAAIPICGGGDVQCAKAIAKVPIWAFHGSADGAVKTQRSRDMIEALKKVDGKALYTEYEGVGHNSWTQTYEDPKVMKWMFEQKKQGG